MIDPLLDVPVSIPIPARFVICDLDERTVALCCPICGCEHVHPEKVQVEQGHTSATITQENAEVRPTTRYLSHRGSVITLRCWCEAGHTFDYGFEFYKGSLRTGLNWTMSAAGPARSQLWRD